MNSPPLVFVVLGEDVFAFVEFAGSEATVSASNAPASPSAVPFSTLDIEVVVVVDVVEEVVDDGGDGSYLRCWALPT